MSCNRGGKPDCSCFGSQHKTSLKTRTHYYEDLLRVRTPTIIEIENPPACSIEGSRKGSGRIVSATKKVKNKTKARTNGKVPFKQCAWNNCGQTGHNKQGCEKPPCKKKLGNKKVSEEENIEEDEDLYEEENIDEDEEDDEDDYSDDE
ncbi:hypothetical protein CTI12_AA359240 [Artemisia annua]|uniref:Uncharacterized protein n=1 Tax=Artemisia annua TaxID=35608 RepID=A0A2U1MNY5_ARTAN|nr:hypothetical protein CTI12_AA359240 [Artemisia annua]